MIQYILVFFVLLLVCNQPKTIYEGVISGTCCGGLKAGRDYCPGGNFGKSGKKADLSPPKCTANCFKDAKDWKTRTCTKAGDKGCCGYEGYQCEPTDKGGWCASKSGRKFKWINGQRYILKAPDIIKEKKINLTDKGQKCDNNLKCSMFATPRGDVKAEEKQPEKTKEKMIEEKVKEVVKKEEENILHWVLGIGGGIIGLIIIVLLIIYRKKIFKNPIKALKKNKSKPNPASK